MPSASTDCCECLNFRFTAYGCFWIALALLLIGNHYNIYTSSGTDIGWFLVAWTAFTAILWIGALRISSALALTFTLLLIGFILLDFAHFGMPQLTVVAGYELMATAAMAWYIMAHLIFADVFGRDVLPVGKPWIGPAAPTPASAAALPTRTPT